MVGIRRGMGRDEVLVRQLRWVLGVFVVGLVLSGVTAFPLLHELDWVAAVRGVGAVGSGEAGKEFDWWILTVREGLREMYGRHAWIGYGTDWLAFAHLAIAVFFIGVFVDPVRNVWILWAGVICCAGVIPLALIGGAVRGIPFGWRLIDCSFGVFGVVPLWYCLRLVGRLEKCER